MVRRRLGSTDGRFDGDQDVFACSPTQSRAISVTAKDQITFNELRIQDLINQPGFRNAD